MALINCPECGNQISDTAKKCPHCGYALKQDETSSHSKSVIGGLLLTVALGFLVLGYWWMMRMSFDYTAESRYVDLESGFLWGGIAVWCISFVTFYFGWKFLNQGVFKSKTATIISCIFGVIMVYAFGLASFNTINRDKRMAEEAEYERMAEQCRAEQLQKEQEEAERKRQEELKWIGTYVYNQPKNFAEDKTLTIEVNEDGSLRAIAVGKTEDIFYGTWNRVKDDDGNTEMITLHFPYEDVTERGHYLLGVWVNNHDNFCYFMEDWVIKDGYLYKNKESIISKNPKNRVKITKVD